MSELESRPGGGGSNEQDNDDAAVPQHSAAYYTALGIEIVPLHTPTPTGCSCHGDCGRSAGKHPRLPNGVNGASADPTTIEGWLSAWPEMNLGARLDTAGLVMVGPDSEHWLAKFEKRGLPATATARSGSGIGRHFYYRRSADCPVVNINKSAEFDINARGYSILPPSLHKSGRRYEWLTPLPSSLDQLPTAPGWVVAWLVEMARRRERQPLPETSVITASAYQPESAEAFLWWSGRLATRRSDGEIDRSQTLWWIAVGLAREVGDVTRLAHAIAERDVALGFHKYTSRPVQYIELASRALGFVAKKAMR